MQFKDVIGQEGIKQRLIKAVEVGRVPHALLFCGGSGVGKLPLAIAFAQYVSCQSPKDGDSCGVCPSCVKYNKLIHPDVHFAYPITRKGSSDSNVTCISYINEWRSMLLKNPYFSLDEWLNQISNDNKKGVIYTNESEMIAAELDKKAYESDTKVMIIWMIDRLMEEGANKILKLLEEPRGKTLFILITENMEQVLSTIVSRTQVINFPPIEDEAVEKALISKYALDETEAKEYAHIASGDMIKAEDAVETSEQNQQFFELFKFVMRKAYAREVRELRGWTNTLAEMGRKAQVSFLQYAQRLIRENFIMNLKNPSLNYMTRQERDFSERFSAFVTEHNVMMLYSKLAEAERDIEQNCQAKLVFFDVALQFCYSIKNR